MKRRVLVAVAVGCAVAIVAGWYLLLWAPRQRAIAAAAAQVATAQQQSAQLSVELARLRSEARALPAKKALLSSLDAAVPSQPDLAKLILSLDGAAAAAGTKLSAIAPSQPSAVTTTAPTSATTAKAGAGAAPPAVSVIKMSLTASGHFAQVLDFLDRLASLHRVVVVNSLTASAGGKGGVGSAPALNVSIAAEAFVVASSGSSASAPVGG
ncbi:MAG: hypothetical protein ACYDH5_16995 [Acidimicrobiales bacterium]